MTSSADIEAHAVRQEFCEDFAVQSFVECHVWRFDPLAKGPRDVIAAAVRRFGDSRCTGLGFTVH